MHIAVEFLRLRLSNTQLEQELRSDLAKYRGVGGKILDQKKHPLDQI